MNDERVANRRTGGRRCADRGSSPIYLKFAVCIVMSFNSTSLFRSIRSGTSIEVEYCSEMHIKSSREANIKSARISIFDLRSRAAGTL